MDRNKDLSEALRLDQYKWNGESGIACSAARSKAISHKCSLTTTAFSHIFVAHLTTVRTITEIWHAQFSKTKILALR